MTDQEQLKHAHRDRVVEACSLAIRHAALLLSPSMQQLADELILKDDPRKLQARKREAVGADLSLILALERLSGLRKTQAWMRQGHYIGLLTDCWCGVAEGLDRQSFRRGKRWVGEDGPLALGEKSYQKEVVMPLIEQSFRTMWDGQ
jgi:hypothetical protein